MINYLAIIPARKDSKGLPGKHMKMLRGQPLIYYTFQSAWGSNRIDEIALTTNDPEILSLGSRNVDHCIKRPDDLATDDTPIVDAIIHCLDSLREKVKNVVLLQPTSPLRKSYDIDQAIMLYEETRAMHVVSVCPARTPPEKVLNKYGDILFGAGTDFKTRRQDYAETYEFNGAIYITSASTIRKKKRLYTPAVTQMYIMNQRDSVDVDTQDDFDLANFYLGRPSA